MCGTAPTIENHPPSPRPQRMRWSQVSAVSRFRNCALEYWSSNHWCGCDQRDRKIRGGQGSHLVCFNNYTQQQRMYRWWFRYSHAKLCDHKPLQTQLIIWVIVIEWEDWRPRGYICCIIRNLYTEELVTSQIISMLHYPFLSPFIYNHHSCHLLGPLSITLLPLPIQLYKTMNHHRDLRMELAFTISHSWFWDAKSPRHHYIFVNFLFFLAAEANLNWLEASGCMLACRPL